MTLDQAIREVQQIIGWRSDKAAEITAALSYSQTEREKAGLTFPPWLLTLSTLTTVANQPFLPLPVDYIQDNEQDEGSLYYQATARSRVVFLKKLDFATAEKHFYGTYTNSDFIYGTDTTAAISPGLPNSYVLTPTQILFYPTPNAIYSLNFNYWASDVAQALGQENKWLKNAPWVLIGDAAQKLASDLGYQAGVSTAAAILSRAEQNMFRATIHRKEAGRGRNMGSRL